MKLMIEIIIKVTIDISAKTNEWIGVEIQKAKMYVRRGIEHASTGRISKSVTTD